MNSRVLVLQEKPENIANIQEALPDYDLVIVDTVNDAYRALTDGPYQLIVSAVHLEHDGSVFDFLKLAKGNPSTQAVPFVFYCSQSSTFARSVRDGLQIAARALGAEKYITMELFDRDALRLELLTFLSPLPGAAGAPVADQSAGETVPLPL